ncbi:uncharacterized protein [Procambarus clarkii]|uniref:uncharacterized protein n=1 Tax=Procambarus clarkii TaxID=6728 RepID=UPI003741E9F1
MRQIMSFLRVIIGDSFDKFIIKLYLYSVMAADCSVPAIAPVNLVSEEDFPPLPVEEDSVDVEVSSAPDVPPESPVAPPGAPPGAPPVVVASPPEVVSSPGDRPAPTSVPGVLQTAFCSHPPSSSSSSAPSGPVPAPSPSVPAVLGDGVDPALPPVPGLVPHVVEDAAVLRHASVRLACVARVSESASGSDDVRPVPKRSRRSSSTWADGGDFDACESDGDGGVAPVALQTTVTAEVHLPEDAGAGVSASTSDMVSAVLVSGASPASDGSGSSWGMVPPAEVHGERVGLAMVLKKPARSGGSVTPSSVPVSSAAVSTPLPSPAVSSASPAVSVEALLSRRLSPAPDGYGMHNKLAASGGSNQNLYPAS